MVYGQKFIPEPHVFHAAVLIDYKIYFIGGNDPNKTDSEQNPEGEIFYFNIDPNDNENLFSWVNIQSQGVKLPHTFSHAADIGGVNQDSIFIIGGAHLDEKDTNYLYRFDTKTNELSVPVIQGMAPPTRMGMKTINYEGKIYTFGGRTFNTDPSKSIYFNQLDILDTINLNWQVGNIVNSPGPLTGYTATLVNGIIYYIGGRSSEYVFPPMTDIFQYDIVGDKWSLKKATTADADTMPGSRTGHSAVLYNGKIYVYGGSYYTSETAFDMPAKETFAMLDVVTLVWSIPPLNGTDIPALAYHTASLKGPAMFISFGAHMESPDTLYQGSNSTYVFFLSEPIIGWGSILLSGTTSQKTSTVMPPSTDTPSSESVSASPQNTMSKSVIVGISVGSVLVVLIIFVVFSIAYKRIKRNQSNIKREFSHPDGQSQIPPDDDKHPSMYLQQ
ncbi:hypothetical protein GLOIN_2v1878605 [Rhizophagus clarus]|uniref:Galactose oxidase n=1 Tax=Rhizophagus clarus TaxID=94130 RepID=A0A8H3L4S8_9GLOM|nr:hypothetical protein GLOIN_2v1878605 [Rhizophagus clarus]